MSEVKVDTISERTAAGGVTIDGVLVKDGVATFQTAAGSPLVFEGATANAFETTFAITDPTADRTITFPDSSFTVPTAGGLFSSYAVIEDQKTLDTNGGTFTSGAWRTRDLNTEVTDPDGIVSISSNQFTLAAGNYLIKWYATAKDVNSHKSALYDITGTAYIDYGSSEDTQDTITVTNKSIGSTRVTPSGSNIYEIRHQCETTDSEEGFGRATGWAVESYCLVEIYKES
tara:strand:+ start:114 stop:803 length:690 start_codon:yes stop_codon:yes gene_type:complete